MIGSVVLRTSQIVSGLISLDYIDIYMEPNMIRTVVSLTEDDKAWLDRRAREEGVTMTEVVRRSVGFYRSVCDPEDADFLSLLKSTAGTWRNGDALEYQRRMRREWGA
jgi:hypothetical protein